MSALLQLTGLTRHFGGLVAVADVDLQIEAGQIMGLIGPNGAGKTTCFNLITGLLAPTAGVVTLWGQPLSGLAPHQITTLGVARTFQNIRLFDAMTARDNVVVGTHCRTRSGVWAGLWRSARARAEEQHARAEAEELLAFVGLDGLAEAPATGLPYGQQRRLEIARALATRPTLLCLDEPAAGMNASESQDLMELIRRIRARGITILLIEHDMYVVMHLCDRLAVLNFGRKIAEGTPAEIQSNPDVITAYLGSNADAAP